MAAAYEAAQRRVPTIETTTGEPVADNMQGGWRFEGKDKPETPIICTRCQWSRRTEQAQEPDKSTWCESCLEGKPGPGHAPSRKVPPPPPSTTPVNKAFFG